MNTEDRVFAPFTDEQVGRLVAWQRSPFVHGFTCPRRDTPQHAWRMWDFGGLTPTAHGWICEEMGCNYFQDWAYTYMVEPPPPLPLDSLERDHDR